MSGRVRDLALHLLDRQVLDTQGREVCKIDDLELTVPEDGSPPYVTAILCGPDALGRRIGGILGGWIVFWARTLSKGRAAPVDRIGMDLLTDLGSAVTVARGREQLGVQRAEDWVRHFVIDRIPGARHASK